MKPRRIAINGKRAATCTGSKAPPPEESAERATAMIDEKLALLRAHRNNINRYRRLLRTGLTELERQFIERRVSEEQTAMEKLVASPLPLIVRTPIPASVTENVPAPG